MAKWRYPGHASFCCCCCCFLLTDFFISVGKKPTGALTNNHTRNREEARTNKDINYGWGIRVLRHYHTFHSIFLTHHLIDDKSAT